MFNNKERIKYNITFILFYTRDVSSLESDDIFMEDGTAFFYLLRKVVLQSRNKLSARTKKKKNSTISSSRIIPHWLAIRQKHIRKIRSPKQQPLYGIQ